MASMRVGRIAGFQLQLDRSWLIALLLILWTYTLGVFPANVPGRTPLAYAVMGTLATLLFFASLLAHEISHSLVARAKGIRVEGITLFIFGGMAHTAEEPRRPADEALIAGVGPLVSLALAALFGFAAALGVQLHWSAAVIGVAAHLAFVNLALAAFNLLPGFPLDGGRIFHAAVWRLTGDVKRATRMAAAGGRWLGLSLMALGVVSLLSRNVLGGIWLILIGSFLQVAAQAAYFEPVLRGLLSSVRAGSLMTPDPEHVSPELTLQGFVDEHVLQGRHQSYPVVEGGSPIGIITLRRVKAVPREEWPTTTVRAAMHPVDEHSRAPEDASMATVLDSLQASPAGRVLVIRAGKVVGIITRSDVARWLQRVELVDRG